MKRNELKQILKPLIKECIKEAILEEGLLSNIISEVVKGLGTNTIVESQVANPQPVFETRAFMPKDRKPKTQINETRKRMLDAIGKDSFNGVDLFEGTTPMRASGQSAAASSKPLSDVDPGDSGVDISGIFAVGGDKWKKLASG